MPNFAVLDGINVINTIVADSKAIAEELTGHTCVEFTSSDPATIGGTYEDGYFIEPQPFEHWILDENRNWIPWIPKPEYDPETQLLYYWSQEQASWLISPYKMIEVPTPPEE